MMQSGLTLVPPWPDEDRVPHISVASGCGARIEQPTGPVKDGTKEGTFERKQMVQMVLTRIHQIQYD